MYNISPLLRVQNGANVSASTGGAGRGGNLKIDAETIEVIGTSTNGSGSRIAALATRTATGVAGNLTIKTGELIASDRAVIAVQSSGTGTAGNLSIDAVAINLDNNAILTANTRSNRVDVNQATININSGDLILRRGSSITTNATGSEVIGGNIDINTDVLALLESSSITANSANSRGGNIDIKTQGLFRSPESKITATGATSQLTGDVNITTLVDPSSALHEIPINLVDQSRLILAGCFPSRSAHQNSFTFTGSGGIPTSPTEPLQNTNIITSWIPVNPRAESFQSRKIGQAPTQAQADSNAKPIVEATAWMVDNRGKVHLVADNKHELSLSLPEPSLCPGSIHLQ